MALRLHITERQRRLGIELRKLREAAGLNLAEAAALIDMGRPHLNHIEAARTAIPAERLRELVREYGCTSAPHIDELVRMAESNGKGWWSEYRKLMPARTTDLAELEDRATEIASYETLLIPGLLQTESYMRALFESARPDATTAETDTLVRFRLARQRILTGERPPRLHAIIHEAALHMVIGGPHVMRDQLAHLIRAAAHEHVTVQVLPFDRAHHTWVSAPFLFLSPGVPGLETVFIEHPAAALSLHEAQDLAHYRATVATLARNALPAIVPTASPDRHEERDSWGLIQHVLYTHRGAPQ
ncbi:helix-turn-helix domain-containing protein [Streptomyces yerevanensis]|nr:helix-turn-helix transcriptional regulator [Streptomyces yerevanensis]